MKNIFIAIISFYAVMLYGQTNPNDTCNVNATQVLYPVTEGASACVVMNTVGAIHETTECQSNYVSLWYNFLTDSNATVAFLEFSNVDANNRFQVFELSCDHPITGSCLNDAEDSSIGVRPATKYLVRIDLDPMLPNQELCISTYGLAFSCHNINMIASREDYPNLDPKGPYFPKEKIKICANINFTVSPLAPPFGNNCQSIEGIIPAMGSGWDYNASNIKNQAPKNFYWLPQDNVALKISNNLFTIFNNVDGNKSLRIGGGKPAKADDLLPGAYWITSPGNPLYCSNDGHPNNMRGMPINCDSITSYVIQNVDFCMNLQIKDYNTLVAQNVNNLEFNLLVMSDGEIGCRTNKPCSLQVPGEFYGEISLTGDYDSDGIIDGIDNCPIKPNTDQADANNDGQGDVCDVDSDSDSDGFFDYLDNCPEKYNPNQVDINSNGVGDVCEIKSFNVLGLCFVDVNQNNIYDKNKDFVLPNVAIQIQNHPEVYFTNQDGFYQIEADSGQNIVTYNINFGQWQQSSIQKNINAINPLNFVFVGFRPASNASASSLLSVNASGLMCNKEEWLYPQVFNDGSSLLSGYLYVTYDPNTYFTKTIPLPSGSDGNTLIWSFLDLPPGKIFTPEIQFQVPDISITDSLFFNTKVYDSDNITLLDSFVFYDKILCNGNKKLSSNWPDREGDKNHTLLDEDITYQIKFENKGQKKANTIRIVNQIDTAHLNVNSLKIQQASHKFIVYAIGNQLIFYADSIDFAISSTTSNPGYINFTLQQKPNLQNNTVVSQSAFFELDNGYKVDTDTLINTIVSVLPCDLSNDEVRRIGNELSVSIKNGKKYTWYDCNTGFSLSNQSNFKPSVDGNYYCIIEGTECKTTTPCFEFIVSDITEEQLQDVKIYPNPNNGMLYIESKNGPVKSSIFDLFGKSILKTEENNISLQHFPNGIYVLKIEQNGKSKVVKLIKQ